MLLEIGLVVTYKLCRPMSIYLQCVRHLSRMAWSTTRNYTQMYWDCFVFATAWTRWPGSLVWTESWRIRMARAVTSESVCCCYPNSSEIRNRPSWICPADSRVRCRMSTRIRSAPISRTDLIAMTEMHLTLRWRPYRVTISADLYLKWISSASTCYNK